MKLGIVLYHNPSDLEVAVQGSEIQGGLQLHQV